MMDDVIYRQDAIDAIRLTFSPWLTELIDPYQAQVKALKELPSAQKKGRWVKVSGYATPGGDPVWACSECGKGLHTYGIEYGSYGSDIADHQWVSCPNCGAVMEENSGRSVD